MRVLILGGTTFFGREIVRQFVEAGHEVSIFTRGRQYPIDFPDVRKFTGDRTRLDDLKKAAGPWDLVIDNIAFDGAGVQAALGAFKDVGRYLLTSTVSVYRFTRDRFPIPWREASVDYDYNPAEEVPTDVHWSYARGKLEAERAIRTQTRFPWTIVRPTVVYGPHDAKARGFWYLERLRRGGPILLANGGVGSFRLAYSLDVATGIRLASLSPKAAGKVFNLAQSEVVTLEQFLTESARALGLKAELVPVPLAELGELGGPHGNLTNIIPDDSAARELGLVTTPFATFMEKTAQWYQDHWKGDRTELLKTRPEELAFAEAWARRGT